MPCSSRACLNALRRGHVAAIPSASDAGLWGLFVACLRGHRRRQGLQRVALRVDDGSGPGQKGRLQLLDVGNPTRSFRAESIARNFSCTTMALICATAVMSSAKINHNLCGTLRRRNIREGNPNIGFRPDSNIGK